jgi:hypothetical protein
MSSSDGEYATYALSVQRESSASSVDKWVSSRASLVILTPTIARGVDEETESPSHDASLSSSFFFGLYFLDFSSSFCKPYVYEYTMMTERE